jgi:hypothetical protein
MYVLIFDCCFINQSFNHHLSSITHFLSTLHSALLKYWPKMNRPIEVLYLMEVEEIMGIIDTHEFTKIMIVCEV